MLAKHRQHQRERSFMVKKILIGVLAVFIVIGIASAGFKFGQHLAQAERAAGR